MFSSQKKPPIKFLVNAGMQRQSNSNTRKQVQEILNDLDDARVKLLYFVQLKRSKGLHK